MIKNDLQDWPKVISQKDGAKIEGTTHIQSTTQIMVDVPVVPRWLSDQLTSFKKTTNNYDDFKTKFQYSLVVFVGTEKADWIIKNQKRIDLAIALNAWVVEDE